MSIDSFMDNVGLNDEGKDATQQIRVWLADIERIDHLKHLEEIVKACDLLWLRPLHHHFTIHGLKHSGHIVAKLANWMAAHDKSSEMLSAMEVFLLLGAAYLHDVGMQCMSAEVLESVRIRLTPEQFAVPDYDILEAIRSKHAEISECMINNACCPDLNREYHKFQLNCGAFEREARVMATISRHHTGRVGDVPTGVRRTELSHHLSPPIRLMLLIHLLRIGDAMDADYRRVNHEFLQTRDFRRIPAKDQLHTLKHVYTSCIERDGIGDFVFRYDLPADASDMKKEIKSCVEHSMREHRAKTAKRLGRHGISFRRISSKVDVTSPMSAYPFTQDVRDILRKMRF